MAKKAEKPAEDVAIDGEAPKKSKKKLIIMIAILVLLLGALGAGGSHGSAANTLIQHIRGKFVAMRTRRANRRELHSFERQFLSELERSENLSEIARQEGNWRSH